MGLFFDKNTVTSSINNISIVENTGNTVTKFVSGIEYYTLGSQFIIDIINIDNLNNETYPEKQVTINADNYGLPELQLSGADLTNWSNGFDNTGASYSRNDWQLTTNNFCNVATSVTTKTRTEDWVSSEWVESTPKNILINTLQDNSTRIFEDFREETRRYTSSFLVWDNTENLTTYDSGNGLQFECDKLVYPIVDYSTYYPNFGNQYNYSLSSGVKYWFWSCYHSGISHTNGQFKLLGTNITESDIDNGYFKIEISLNFIDWFDCCSDYAGGVIGNGDGCRVSPDIYNLSSNGIIAFTFGTGKFTDVTTGPEGFGIYVRMSWTDDLFDKYIGSFQEITWV